MRRLNLTIAIGLVAALFGAGIVLAYGRNVEQAIADGKETVAVLVTTRALEAGASAAELSDATNVKKVPREYATTGAVDDLGDIAGMVLGGPVAQGAQLSSGQFVAPSDLALLEPENGHVAVAVDVGLSPGVARYVQPGSWVDVFVTYDSLSATQGAVPVSTAAGKDNSAKQRTKLFLSGVRVLSVSVAPPSAQSEEDDDAARPQMTGVIAVLELRPLDAERVVNATTLGDLYLALSREGERHKTPKGVTPDDVVKANRAKNSE